MVQTSTKPTILISNDDGYRSAGVLSLAEFVSDFGEVYTVAPDRERSACGHSLTIHRPLRVEDEGQNLWIVDGTPTDCVHLGLRGDLLPQRPTLVLTGINHGSNLGDEITYSGTVGGAMEACLLGVPAIAFSCVSSGQSRDELQPLGDYIRHIVNFVLTEGMDPGILLNVNFPDPRRTSPKGLRVAAQGRRRYGAKVVEKADPRRRTYYWIGGEILDQPRQDDTDVAAVDDGYCAVTPIQLNLTDRPQLSRLQDSPLAHLKETARDHVA